MSIGKSTVKESGRDAKIPLAVLGKNKEKAPSAPGPALPTDTREGIVGVDTLLVYSLNLER
jgi:hypothetical protein